MSWRAAAGPVLVILVAGCASATSTPEATPPPTGLLTVHEAAAAFPSLTGARRHVATGGVRVVGRRCGLVPNEAGGRGVRSGRGPTVTIYRTLSVLVVEESVVRVRDVAAATAVLQRYRDYLARCGGRRFSGDWEGTVVSDRWAVPTVGDDAVGMLDHVDTRGGPITQRTVVARSGRSVVVLRVSTGSAEAAGPASVVRLARSAV